MVKYLELLKRFHTALQVVVVDETRGDLELSMGTSLDHPGLSSGEEKFCFLAHALKGTCWRHVVTSNFLCEPVSITQA